MNHMTVDGIDAPWNQSDPPEKEVEVTICMSISKTVKILVDDYEVYENGLVTSFANCDLYKAVTDQVTLPTNLPYMVETLFKEDLDLKAAKMPKYLKYALEDCKDWDINDFEVILE